MNSRSEGVRGFPSWFQVVIDLKEQKDLGQKTVRESWDDPENLLDASFIVRLDWCKAEKFRCF